MASTNLSKTERNNRRATRGKLLKLRGKPQAATGPDLVTVKIPRYLTKDDLFITLAGGENGPEAWQVQHNNLQFSQVCPACRAYCVSDNAPAAFCQYCGGKLNPETAEQEELPEDES